MELITRPRRATGLAGLLAALLLAALVAPLPATAHPGHEDKTSVAGEGLGVAIESGFDAAEFLPAVQWAGTPTITDEDTLTGELGYVPGGCTPLSYANADVEGKIAFVDEAATGPTNPCPPTTFFQKVRFAEAAGAIGFLQVPRVQSRGNATAIATEIPALELNRETTKDAAGKDVAVEDDLPAQLRDAVRDGATVEVTFEDRRTVYPNMGFTPCQDGQAGPFECDGIDLLGFVSQKAINSAGISDLWGWTDPGVDGEPGTDDPFEGDEYVIMGKTNGVAFYRITDPTNPEILGELANPGVTHEVWHDIKVYADHAFIVSESEGHGMEVFDLTRLRELDGVDNSAERQFEKDAWYRLATGAHNLEINTATGYAYIVGGNAGIVVPDQCLSGLHFVNIQDPKDPRFEGCFVLEGGPGTAARVAGSPVTDVSPAAYVHDAQCVIYDGPDTEHTGKEICLTAAEDKVVVVDVTNKAAPRLLGSTDYDHVGYTHQGWFDETQSFWIVNDELDELRREEVTNTRTVVLDVRDLDDPKPHDYYHQDTVAITHNNYVVGDHLFQSNYAAGLRVADISGVADKHIEEVAWFDTYPTDSNTSFDGTWSNYPFFPSGTIAVSGRNEGLFLLGLADDGSGEETLDVTCADCPVEIRSGDTGTATLAITTSSAEPVELTVSDVPEGWTVTAPDSVTPSDGAASATVTIEVPNRTRAGDYGFMVTARSGDLEASTPVAVSVVKSAARGGGGDRPGGPPADRGPDKATTAAAATLASAPVDDTGSPAWLVVAALVVLAGGLGTSSAVRRRMLD